MEYYNYRSAREKLQEDAKSKNATPKFLEDFYHSKAGQGAIAKKIIAKHLNTPPQVLTLLAEDKNLRIKEMVLNNPNTPKNIKAGLQRYLTLKPTRQVGQIWEIRYLYGRYGVKNWRFYIAEAGKNKWKVVYDPDIFPNQKKYGYGYMPSEEWIADIKFNDDKFVLIREF